MPLPEHVLRYWRAADRSFRSLRQTRWGAVVTDPRYPAVWDVNYARVDVPTGDVSLAEIAGELAPALAAAGVATFHTVSYEPDPDAGMLEELAAAGHARSWDVVMDLAAPPEVDPIADVVELSPGPELWATIRETFALFGVETDEARTQLARIEEEVLTPAGKRWFGVRDGGRIVASAALMIFDRVGHVDNVTTFPEARGRGFATAITARIVEEAPDAGADHLMLFADPDAPQVLRLYERLGFREVGRIAATRGPVPG
ncbi:MAG TPA: GNAT family N-acetyltransferase [Actinomycetota bacterium]